MALAAVPCRGNARALQPKHDARQFLDYEGDHCRPSHECRRESLTCGALQRDSHDLAAEAHAEHALPAPHRRGQQLPQAHHPGLAAERVARAARHRNALLGLGGVGRRPKQTSTVTRTSLNRLNQHRPDQKEATA